MRTIRRIEIDTDHPNASTLIRAATERLADDLDRRGVHWEVTLTDAVGTPLSLHGSPGSENDC